MDEEEFHVADRQYVLRTLGNLHSEVAESSSPPTMFLLGKLNGFQLPPIVEEANLKFHSFAQSCEMLRFLKHHHNLVVLVHYLLHAFNLIQLNGCIFSGRVFMCSVLKRHTSTPIQVKSNLSTNPSWNKDCTNIIRF